MWYNVINNIYKNVYCMQYFITVLIYCILRVQYFASTLTDSVGEGAASQTEHMHAHYTCIFI